MTYTRKNKGVCSLSTEVTLTDDGVIESVTVVGGCNGNLKGISALLTGTGRRTPSGASRALPAAASTPPARTRSRWRWKKRWQNEPSIRYQEHQKHGPRGPCFFRLCTAKPEKRPCGPGRATALRSKAPGHRSARTRKKNTGPAARVFFGPFAAILPL